MLIPKLRFKEFNDDWQEKKLEDVATRFEYGMNLPSKDYDGYNRYIRITDIDEETRNYISNLPVSPDGKLEDKYIVNKNDILFSRTGASVGKTYLYKEKDGKLYFAGFLIRVHINELYNSYFIFSQTLIDRYFKWVSLTSMRTGQPGINSQEYAQYKIYLPSLEEQTRISNFLSLIDKKIELQTQLVDNLNLYKKGLLKKVFSNNSGWKTDKLGKYIIQLSNRNKNNIDYDVLSVSNSKGFIKQTEQFNDRELASENKSNYKIVHKYEFAYNPARINVGSIAMLESFNCGIVSPMYVCFKCNNIYHLFLKYFFSTNEFKNQMKVRLEGSVRMCLSYEALSNIDIKIPSIEEQNRIADLFTNLDKKIDFETNKLNNLKEYKKGLLQKMFI